MNMPFGLTIFFGSLTVWAGLLIWGLTHKKFTPFIIFGIAFLLFMNVRYLIRKLPQTVNNMKIETSISLEMRDEEVEIYGKPNCWDIGRG